MYVKEIRYFSRRRKGAVCYGNCGGSDPRAYGYDYSRSYGYNINRVIQRITGGQYELKEATLYTAFRRLEQSGLIVSYWGDENTGARRRYYSITSAGRAYYETLLSDWEYSRNIIEQLIR